MATRFQTDHHNDHNDRNHISESTGRQEEWVGTLILLLIVLLAIVLRSL